MSAEPLKRSLVDQTGQFISCDQCYRDSFNILAAFGSASLRIVCYSALIAAEE
jgi:hypothetical protein